MKFFSFGIRRALLTFISPKEYIFFKEEINAEMIVVKLLTNIFLTLELINSCWRV